MYTQKLGFKLFKLILIVLGISNALQLSNNQSKDPMGAMESKIETFADLISFDPMSIQTNCEEVKTKYEEYQQAMLFSDGISPELMTETMQNLGKLRTLSKDLTSAVDDTNELSVRQDKLLELRAERKAQEMQWREDWSRRHMEMERERQKRLTGVFLQTRLKVMLEEVTAEMATIENDIKILKTESDVYEQKILQIEEEAKLMQIQLESMEKEYQTYVEMFNEARKQMELFESMKSGALSDAEFTEIQEKQLKAETEYNEIVEKANQLAMSRNALQMKYLDKQNTIQALSSKQSEITQKIMEKNIEVTELSSQQTTMNQYYETTETTTYSTTSTMTTTAQQYESMYFNTSAARVYSAAFYEYEDRYKEIQMKIQILWQQNSSLSGKHSYFQSLNFLTEEQQADYTIVENELNEIQRQIIDLQNESYELERKMQEEQSVFITNYTMSGSEMQGSQESQLYHLLKVRLTEVIERLLLIEEALKENRNKFEANTIESEIVPLTNEKMMLEQEKVYKEREKASLEEEINKQQLKAQNISTTSQITYTEVYYEFQSSYEAINYELQQINIQIIEIENNITATQLLVDASSDESEKTMLLDQIQLKNEEKKQLETRKEQLTIMLQEQARGLTEEKEQILNTAATQSKSTDSVEQLIMYIKRYNEISLQIMSIFQSISDYRQQINEIYMKLTSSTVYDQGQTKSSFEQIIPLNAEIDKLELQQIALRQDQETIISEINNILNQVQKAKEIDYLHKYATFLNVTLPYQISAITTLPCGQALDNEMPATSSSDGQQSGYSLDHEISATSSYDIGQSSFLKRQEKPKHHDKKAHNIVKSLIEFPDVLQVQYSNLVMLQQQNLPCESHSEGTIEMSAKATTIIYPAKYYEILIEMEETFTQYMMIMKKYYASKQELSKLTSLKEMGLMTQEEEGEIIDKQGELLNIQSQESESSSKIEVMQKEIEMMKIQALDDAVEQNFSGDLHVLILTYAKLKVQYILTVIRMKVMTMLREINAKSVGQLFQQLELMSYSEEEFKEISFSLVYMNKYMIELDKQSLTINQQRITLFNKLKAILLQISSKQAEIMGEQSSFVIDETSSTGIAVSNDTIVSEEYEQTEGLTELQQSILKLQSSGLTYETRITLLRQIVTLIKQEITDLTFKQSFYQQLIKNLVANMSSVQTSLTTIEQKIKVYSEKLLYFGQLNYIITREIKQQITYFKEEIITLNSRKTLLIETYNQYSKLYKLYSSQQQLIIEQSKAYTQQQTVYESSINQVESEVTEQQTTLMTMSVEELEGQINQLLIDIEDPNKSECEKQAIKDQLLNLIDQIIGLFNANLDDQIIITADYYDQLLDIYSNIQQSTALIANAQQSIADSQAAVEYYTLLGNSEPVQWHESNIQDQQNLISEQQALLTQYLADYDSVQALYTQSVAAEQAINDEIAAYYDLWFEIYMLEFDCMLSVSTEPIQTEKQSGGVFFNESAVTAQLESANKKLQELLAIPRLDFTELEILKIGTNYEEYKSQIIRLIPAKLAELSKYQADNQIDIGYFKQLEIKLTKKQVLMQKVLGAYTKLQENSEKYDQVMKNGKLLQLSINSIKNLINYYTKKTEEIALMSNYYNKRINQLMGTSHSTDIDEVIPGKKEQLVTSYWINEATLSEDVKIEQLKQIMTIYSQEIKTFEAQWKQQTQITEIIKLDIEHDNEMVKLFQSYLAYSEDRIEQIEDANAEVKSETYQEQIDSEKNNHFALYQENITYWEASLATNQASLASQLTAEEEALQRFDQVSDEEMYYQTYHAKKSMAEGDAQQAQASEQSEEEYSIFKEYTETYSKISTNAVEESETITTITTLIEKATSLLDFAVSKSIMYSISIYEYMRQIRIVKGEKSVKESFMNYLLIGDSVANAELIEQLKIKIEELEISYKEMEITLAKQIEVNKTMIQRIISWESSVSFLKSELVKIENGYGKQFGVYDKIAKPQGKRSISFVNLTKVEQSFFTTLMTLSSVEMETSMRIIILTKVIIYMEEYVVNVTRYQTTQTAYLKLLSSSTTKFEKLQKEAESELSIAETEVSQNTELLHYYKSKGMTEKITEIELLIVEINIRITKIHKKINLIKISSISVKNAITYYEYTISIVTEQLTEVESSLEEYKTYEKTVKQIETAEQLQKQKQSTQTQQYVVGSNDTTTKVGQIETEIYYLSTEEITITTKILKITKIVTTIKTEITTITRKQIELKNVIQKVMGEQYKIKIQQGTWQAKFDSYTTRLEKIQQQLTEFASDQQKVEELQSEQIKLMQEKENAKSQIEKLTITYTTLQTQIDTYLVEENTYSQQIIGYKQQLLNYSEQQKELQEQQAKLEKEEIEKKQVLQVEQQKHLELEKQRIENLKDVVDEKKKLRDEACRVPEPDAPVKPEVVIHENKTEDVKEEKKKEEIERKVPQYKPYKYEEPEKRREEERRGNGAQKGFELRIPGNPYTPPKPRPEEEIYRRPKATTRYDDGWEQFKAQKEKEAKMQNYTLPKSQEHVPYAKEDYEGGVYRIKRRLHDILYQFGEDEFFVQIKSTMENYLKVLVEKEHVIKQKEIRIKEQSIRIENNERRIEHKAANIKQDLEKCQLDFPLIRKQAEAIKTENYTAKLQEQIQRKLVELNEQEKKTEEAEKEVEAFEEKVAQEEEITKTREVKLTKSNPEAFFTYTAPEIKVKERKEHLPVEIKEYVPTEIKREPAPLKVPETPKEIEQATLKKEEKELDKELEAIDDPVIVTPQEEKKIQKEEQIKKTEEKIKQEEKKIEEEKKTLVIEKKKIELEIEKCKLNFGDIKQESPDELSSEQKEKYNLCVTNKEKFQSDKEKLDHEITLYEELYKELQEEKGKFEKQKETMKNFQVSGDYKSRQLMLTEITKSLKKQAMWKHINKQLKLVNELAESNSRQQEILEQSIQGNQEMSAEHKAAIKSMKYIQSFTERIAAKLNVILSQLPEDREKLRAMAAEVIKEIDKLYTLAMKQKRIVSSINALRSKSRELLTMKAQCLQRDKLLKQTSFLQGQMQMNSNRKRVSHN